jgi:3-hydroxyisobutyrate dehydrogenase-like beta-hydroxyacid dehydrogenase
MAQDISNEPTVVAVLGLGEAGTALAAGLMREWRGADASRRVIAVDTALGDNLRGAAIQDRARDLGIAIEGHYTSALAAADVVFCVVTGVEAKHAARAARQFLRPGTLYFDINTLTGPQTMEIAAAMTKAGIDYVDFAAMGGFADCGHKVPFVLAGPAAERAADWMRPYGFVTRIMSARAGDASAVKIIRSVMVKGIEALGVECLVAARRADLLDEVLDCFSDIDARSFAGMVKSLTTTHPVHARRRMEEMDKAIENLRELGVDPFMSQRTRASHARTVASGVAPEDGALVSFEETIKLLSENVVKGLP